MCGWIWNLETQKGRSKWEVGKSEGKACGVMQKSPFVQDPCWLDNSTGELWIHVTDFLAHQQHPCTICHTFSYTEKKNLGDQDLSSHLGPTVFWNWKAFTRGTWQRKKMGSRGEKIKAFQMLVVYPLRVFSEYTITFPMLPVGTTQNLPGPSGMSLLSL